MGSGTLLAIKLFYYLLNSRLREKMYVCLESRVTQLITQEGKVKDVCVRCLDKECLCSKKKRTHTLAAVVMTTICNFCVRAILSWYACATFYFSSVLFPFTIIFLE